MICVPVGTEAESAVDRTINDSMKTRLLSVRGWSGFHNPWMPQSGDDANVEYSYINLLRNPERYTGYKGEHANRIWSTIYAHNCFKGVNNPDTCAEVRVFYR